VYTEHGVVIRGESVLIDPIYMGVKVA
jgi:hypothetical protein